MRTDKCVKENRITWPKEGYLRCARVIGVKLPYPSPLLPAPVPGVLALPDRERVSLPTDAGDAKTGERPKGRVLRRWTGERVSWNLGVEYPLLLDT